MRKFFFDTYALFELINGNPEYKPYGHQIVILTTRFNLLELHYGLLRRRGKDLADNWFNAFIKYAIDIPDEIFKTASQFRYVHKKRNLSYIDCIGYVLAEARGVPFLTGDMQFADLPNVEFVH